MNSLGTILLETPHLRLRRIEEKDWQVMYDGWASLEECSRYFPWSAANDKDMYREKVLTWVQNYAEEFYFNWLIVDKESEKVIGMINLHDVNVEKASAETSYVLAPKYWGQGIMTEALEGVLAFAFEKVGMKQVQADVFQENEASARVLEKCGMKKEGILERKYCKEGKYVDSVLYAICRDVRMFL